MSNYDLITVLKLLRVPSQFGTDRGMADFFAQYPDGVFATYSGAAPAGWQGYRVYFGGSSERLASMFETLLGDAFRVEGLLRSRVGGRLVLSFRCRARVPSRAAMFNYEQYEKKLIETYLNFLMPNGGTITLTRTGSPTTVELEYSIDHGRTWTVWNEVGNVRSLTLTAGQRMYVRNTSETSTGFTIDGNNKYNFDFSNIVYAQGEIASLLCNTPSNGIYSDYCFAYLFDNCYYLATMPTLLNKPTNAVNVYRCTFRDCNSLKTVILPPITSNSIFAFTFQRGTMIEKAIVLSTSTSPYSLYYTFNSCSSLNKVLTNITSITGIDATNGWLSGVAATGDFYCPSTLTIPTGASGIPSGWTRHDID